MVQNEPASLYSRTSTFIQTRPSTPKNPSLTSTLFIQRPQDFFSGSIGNLAPENLYVRREFQNFRLLLQSGAVVMSTRTELIPLKQVRSREGKKELMEEFGQWTDEEETFKGKSLWIHAVRSWCEGGDAFRDDRTVFEAGDGTVVGDDCMSSSTI